MRSTLRFALLVWLLAGSLFPAADVAATPAGDEAADRLQREALAGEGAWTLVAGLTTEVGPRFAGTPGDAQAVAWAQAKLRALGFPRVWTEPVAVPRWIRGEAAGEIVAPWPQRVVLVALGGSVGTGPAGIEAEVVAVEDVEALQQLADEAIAGRIVYLRRRMVRGEDGRGYGATVPIRTRGAAAAAKKGALAVLIRSVGTDRDRIAHTGMTRYEEGGPRIPAAALSIPDAELLDRQLASGRPVRFRLHLGCRAEAAGAQSANVLAEFPGRERPEEVVLLAAHLDSWDVGQGAQDNGTGVAIVTEAARLAAQAAGGAPRRTLRVLLTANEEFGLSGARAYAATHAEEVGRHVLAAEADAGSGRVVGLRTRFLPADAAAAAELGHLLAPLGAVPEARPAGGGADLSRLRPLGVPLADLAQDGALYFDVHHTDNDTLDRVDRDALRQITAAFATLAWWAAEREARLGTLPPEPPAEP